MITYSSTECLDGLLAPIRQQGAFPGKAPCYGFSLLTVMSRSLVFLIDVEPDGRGEVREDRWAGLLIALREISHLREVWSGLTKAQVHFNWFLRCDPQIERTWGRADWIQEVSPDFPSIVRRHGDLTGIHPHFWRWHEGRRVWFNDFADPAWIENCVQTSVEGHRAIFGNPVASRCGDRWLDETTMRILHAAGIRYDLTIEPGTPSRPMGDDPLATADLPDFRNAPRSPHRAALPGGDFWLLPVTTSFQDYWIPQRSFPFLKRSAHVFNLVLHPRRLWRHMAAELDRTTPDPLVFVVRAGDLGQRRFFAAFRYCVERMTRHPMLPNCRFLRVDEAIERFRVAGGGA